MPLMFQMFKVLIIAWCFSQEIIIRKVLISAGFITLQQSTSVWRLVLLALHFLWHITYTADQSSLTLVFPRSNISGLSRVECSLSIFRRAPFFAHGCAERPGRTERGAFCPVFIRWDTGEANLWMTIKDVLHLVLMMMVYLQKAIADTTEVAFLIKHGWLIQFCPYFLLIFSKIKEALNPDVR